MHTLHQSRRAACRSIAVFAFVLALAFTANAYTIVTSGGRHLEIPSQFVVTGSTLTYEVSPGVQVTMLLATIDIAATEKANNEPPGSFLRRGGQAPSELSAKTTTQTATARRTITNGDLKPHALRRQQSESAYEVRRKELRLPSVEESRRQAAAEAEQIKLELAEQQLEDSKSEAYWRERATALRTEMAAMDGELNWIRARLDEVPTPGYAWNSWNGLSGGAFATVIGVSSFGNGRGGFGRNFGGSFGGRGGFHRGGGFARPGVFVAPRGGRQLTARVPFGGGATRGRVLVNPGFRPGTRGAIAGGFPVFPGAVFGSFPAYDYSYERSDLITRFNQLAGARAGLNAHWRELEDEARRAGAPPGWLRE
jgi:uncharacterized membrane protein YgcG